MNWGIVSTIIVAVVFGIPMFILAVKAIRRKQPAWAYKTVEIIDLGENAPPELQLSYEGKSIRGAYRTTVLLFNSGSGVIDSEDVTVPMTVRFIGGEVLGEPEINKRSNVENKVSVIKNEANVVTDFMYLGNNDGIVFEVLHTAAKIDFNVNVKGVKGSKYKGEFDDFSNGVINKTHIMALILGTLGIISLVLFLVINPAWSKLAMDNAALVVVLLSIIGVFAFGAAIPQYIRSRKFPRWSRRTITETNKPVSQKGINNE